MPDHEQDPWPHLHRHAAQQLGGDIADRVLRRRRLATATPRPLPALLWSGATAVLCFVAVVLVGERVARQSDVENLGAWRTIAQATEIVR